MTAPQFEALLAVQEIDTALDQVRHRRATLPARAELTDVTKARADLVARRREAAAARDEMAGRQAQMEAELTATEQRRAAVSARLYSGEVSASRELQTLSADIETLGRRASDLEDGILGLLDELEPLEAAVAELDAAGADLDRREAAATEELAAGEREADAEEAELASRRDRTAEPVPADVLQVYQRLRTRLGGVGAARLVGRHCDGCHLELPATELDRIRHAPEDALFFCDQCGRILIRP
ncbi:MAG TPA: C4-type zinc ribbon domain-containing protein [Acidimicrobiales bacterium]|nr:C4-type zinc ribbon domain-containing protein [Acidimicrobiales bacterium]